MKKAMFSLCVLVVIVASPVFGTTHTVVTSGFSFSPDSIAITVGDTVQFVLGIFHNAVEVSHSTWLVNDTTSLPGGFTVGDGGGTVVFTQLGTHYYVCQHHASLGMKGIVTVNPAVAQPNTVVIQCHVDQDGSLATTGDHMAKNWSLTLYQDSVGSGIVLGSVPSGASLSVPNLPAGTYVAVEADSAPWSHISVNLNGISQGPTGVNQWPVTVTSGQTRTVDFINFAPRTIISSGLTFSPDSIGINPGDTVHFVLETMHTAREVSQATWLADDTASNGGFDLPFGGGSAILTTAGTHYYVCVPHAAFGMKGRIVVRDTSGLVSILYKLQQGWNMISLPVQVSDPAKTALFPTASSDAFDYEGSYKTQTTLAIGPGYWMKFDASQSMSLPGLPRETDTISVAAGWNMIGSLSSPIPAGALGTDPPGIISSQVFGFNGGYNPADTIQPGSGYWVKVSQQGKLIENHAAAFFAAPARAEKAGTGMNLLTVKDALGGQQTLFLSTGNPSSGRWMEELPPLPPEGAFDVRFAPGFRALNLEASRGEEIPIQVTSAKVPFSIGWELDELTGRSISLLVDNHEVPLEGKGTLNLNSSVSSLALRVDGSSSIPSEYSLSQAFPNPFNPVTTISYTLPLESRVTVRIYDVLGREVATLVDRIESAGVRSVAWEAGGYSSGLYIVRMDAAPTTGPGRSFVQVNKVILAR